MDIVFFVFEQLTALDLVGPQEVLSRLPGARVRFAGLERGPVRCEHSGLGLCADVTLAEVTSCDLLVVPGGFGTRVLQSNARVLDWLRALDRGTRITASVCTGALLLGSAGLLQGRRANTHWAVRERLRDYGAIPVAERVVRDGKYATAAGVSAGIDLALTLCIELGSYEIAQAIALGIEYDPAPPVDSGDVTKAPPALVERMRARVLASEAALQAGERNP